MNNSYCCRAKIRKQTLVAFYSTLKFYCIAYIIHSNILKIVSYLFISSGLFWYTHINIIFSVSTKYCYIFVACWWLPPMGLHKKASNETFEPHIGTSLSTDELYLVILSLHTLQIFSFTCAALSLFIFSTFFFFTDRLHKVFFFFFHYFILTLPPLCSHASHLISRTSNHIPTKLYCTFLTAEVFTKE